MAKKIKNTAKKSAKPVVIKEAAVEKKDAVKHDVKPSLFKAGIVAFVVIAVINFVVNGILLAPVWSAMEVAGVVREGQGGQIALAGIFGLMLVMGFVLAWLVKRAQLKGAGAALGFGVVIGIFIAVPDVAGFLFYRVPAIVPIVGLVANIVGFALASMAPWFVNN